MKILYDHQILTAQKYGGISRYFYELVKKFDVMFKSKADINTKTAILFSNNYYISQSHLIRFINLLPNTVFRGKIRLMSFFNKINSSYQLKKQKFDLFHPSYYDPYFLNSIGDKPFILTVYDMIHEKHGEFFLASDSTSNNKKLLAEKAARIIAISQSTKDDLISLFNMDPEKIDVVYLGNSMSLDQLAFEQQEFPEIKLPQEYILFVGSRSGYKNFERFIKATNKILEKNTELSIVCAGGGGFSDEETNLFAQLNIHAKVFQYNVDDQLLAKFYQNAQVFVFPSLYEGFGIPVLEAFACDCPLLCSNTSSLPEIASDAAKYFDPYSEESIYNAIATVIKDNKLKQELVEKGRERLIFFSWEKTAIETKQVYQRVLS